MNGKTKSLVLIGAASYFLAWFVPVVEGGNDLTSGTLPGWQAFRYALSPIWSYEDLDLSARFLRPVWYWSLLCVVTGLTNFVLLWALFRIILRPNQPRPLLRATLFACCAFNTWFLLVPDRGALKLGYYMWAIAFFLMAAGIGPSRTIEHDTMQAV